jgi:glutamate-1-semialdehyde 2,1-aminomutase
MRYAIRTSLDLFRASREVIPGGLNGAVRSLPGFGNNPVFVSHAKGCQVFDAEGRSFIDYIGGWGQMILGHANNEVIQALSEQIRLGTDFGLPSGVECELAELVREMVPSVEMIRFVNSGTEACLAAVRLARAVTGRDRLIKFAGCYHGHADSLLVEADSEDMGYGTPASHGIPERLAAMTEVAHFNDLPSVERIFDEYPNDIAAVFVEPVPSHMGVVPPREGFLEGLRSLCSQHGALLVFDETTTGFRLARGGAQEEYRVYPDLTLLGKIVGGGLPVGALGGAKDLLEHLSPSGQVIQAEVHGGNPLTMAAGLKTLQMLRAGSLYQTIEDLSRMLAEGLRERAGREGVPIQVNRVGSMLSLFFIDHQVTDLESVHEADRGRHNRFYNALLGLGVLIPPSLLESWFVSGAHAEMHIRKTLDAAEKAFKEV